ncbi:MAG: efflux RND transporter periplasmic adaptor subunit [Bryobacteraceae bacterium]
MGSALAIAVAVSLVLTSCMSQAGAQADSAVRPSAGPERPPGERLVRVTGIIQALRSVALRVPQISAQSGRVTLAALIPNGSTVSKGDTLAEFDQTAVLDEERDIKAKLSEATFQLDERRAKARSDAAKRGALLAEAEADLAKAQIQLRKAEILSDIDRRKNETLAGSAKAREASLKKSNALRDSEEAAAIGVLDKKRERLAVQLERIKSNLEKLVIKAPLNGMIALENTWRNGSMGPPQEGDMLSPGQPVLRIFDPGEMVVQGTVSEADVAALPRAASARVYLDAYPGVSFEARLESASPVATAGLDSPIRTFSARFRLFGRDPRLLPDLSASLEIIKDSAK